MLLQIFLRETKLLALTNVQVDLMSDVRNNGGALEIVIWMYHKKRTILSAGRNIRAQRL